MEEVLTTSDNMLLFLLISAQYPAFIFCFVSKRFLL